MKKKKLLSFILSILVACSCIYPIGATADTDAGESSSTSDTVTDTQADTDVDAQADSAAVSHTVKAKAALLLELGSGQTLLEQNADERVYPASLTKVMTCLLTLEHGTLTDTVTVSETALQNLDAAGSTAGLKAGEQLSVEELLYCIMLSSANEACNVAAEYIAGSVDAFVDMMNEEAQALGCTGTHFANPHGLHDENHYTTARDLSIIVQEAMKSQTFLTITSTVTHTVPATNLSEERELFTTNLLETPGTQYYYEYAAGIKTGFTTPAGRCLISTAQRPDSDLHLLSVVCGAADVTAEDGTIINENFTETKALFEYGFENFSYDTVLEANPVTEIPVFMSAGCDAAVLAADQAITAVMPKDYDETQLKQTLSLDSPNGVEAPIAKGQKLGTVTVSYQGKELGTANLVAITDTPRSELVAQVTKTGNFLTNHPILSILGALVFLFVLYLIINNVQRARRRKRRRLQMERRRRQQDIIRFPGNQTDDRE